MKTTRRIRVASLLAVAALGLSACGTVEDLTGGGDDTQEGQESSDGRDSGTDDGDSGTDDGADEESTEEESAEEEPTDEETDGGEQATEEEPTDEETGSGEPITEGETDGTTDGPAGGSTSLTAPGTTLKVGDTATIPQGDEGGTVQVTVSKITEGSYADLANLKDADDYKDYTPVYVEYTITGTENSSVLEYSILDDVDPITQDGNKAGSLVIFSGGGQSFDKCDTNSFPKDFGPGQTVKDCDIAMLADGQELGGAMFQQFEGEYAEANKITWES